MKVLAIAIANLRRMLRERSNIFFVFIFPIAVILLIGVQFGGGVDPVIGLVAPEQRGLAGSVADAVRASEEVDTRDFDSEEALVKAVERGQVQAGLFIPAELGEVVSRGETAEIGFVVRPDGFGPQLQAVVGSAISRVMQPVGAAQFATAETGRDFDTALDQARAQATNLSGIEVETSTVGEALFPPTLGRFDLGASQQLVLFTFLTALTGSAALILSRKLGISQRMLSTPTSASTIVAGESAGRFAVAFLQGIYIMGLTWVIFRVDWGEPLGAILILLLFSAVGAGAGMLMGAVLENDQQAAGIGVVASLGLAALGGAMLPLELFSPTMRMVAHSTPHAWALDGFAELVRRGGSTIDILPELGILALYAAVLLGLAAWRLRLAITRPG
ncbi:MAG: ABC transporter permease [Acidimicrobiia bacterium]